MICTENRQESEQQSNTESDEIASRSQATRGGRHELGLDRVATEKGRACSRREAKMSLFNFGGPGWFNDVFEVEIKVDDSRTTTCHSLLFQETCPLFTTSESITGEVIVRPPEGRVVWQGGIKILLECTLSFFESLSSRDEELLEITLTEPSFIEKETSFKFDIDLAKLPSDFIESYDGEMFSVRHTLVLTVVRPWWTFDVMRSTTISIQTLSEAPSEQSQMVDDDLTLPLTPRLSSPNREVVTPSAVAPASDATMNRLRVVDVYQGLSLIYETAVLNLGDTFRGEITLGGGNPADIAAKLPSRQVCPLTSLQVVIYKIETGDEDSNEVILLVHNVDLPSSSSAVAPPVEPSTEDEVKQIQEQVEEANNTQVVEAASYVPPSPITIPVEIPLVKTEKSGEFGATIIKKDITVRYFVRLVAIDTQANNFWNTHELVLYRPTVQTVETA